MQKFILPVVMLVLTANLTQAQSFAVNTTGAAADASAMLDITSTTKGLLIPRMTSAQRSAIAAPAEGLQVYQTDAPVGLYIYRSGAWTVISTGTGWSITGNAGTGGSGFMGSTDNVDVAFRTNNTEVFRMTSGQSVGIGVAAPSQKLHISDVSNPNQATIRVSGLASTTTLALGTAPFNAVMIDANGVFYRGGTTGSPTNAWFTTGNSGTAPATNFMGSTDNVDVAFRTNNLEAFRMTNAQRLLIGVTTPTAPGTQRLEVSAATGDAIYGHSPNIGGWLGYETNFTVGTAGAIQGAGVYASNAAAGYVSSYAASSGAATVAANINFSSVWIGSYNLVDNSSNTFNPSALYSQLNNTSTTMGAGAFKNAIYGYSNRGTTAGNPGYTVGLNGVANSQNEDAIGIVGRSFGSSGFSLGGYFEGNTYPGANIGYAYVGGNDGFGATKITGLGTVSEIIPTPNHGRVTLTCPESPEYWYQDYGSVKLVNGKAHVNLDPILVDVVFVDDKNPIRVFCTPVDMLYFNGVTIVNQTPTGFDLVELNGGKHSGTLDYQLVVKPKTNYGVGRFPQAPGPAWVKSDKEPAAAKAKNNPKDGRKIFRWPAETETYNYKPEDLVEVGEEVQGGKYHGMIKMADGTFKPANPADKSSITNEKK
ncbi:MAG: hypothetical protein JNM14_10210 [Ferruginibacter sp.]|nr:hypothetical protein [Ferruginibacter sp.]